MTNYQTIITTVLAVGCGLYFAVLTAAKESSANSTTAPSAKELQKPPTSLSGIVVADVAFTQLEKPAVEEKPRQVKEQPVRTTEPLPAGQSATTTELAYSIVDAQQFMLAKVSGGTWAQQNRVEFMDHFARVDDATREQMLSELSTRLNDGTLQLEGDGPAF